MALERLHPEGARAMARLEADAWEAADPALLGLCGLRVAQMLGNERLPAAGCASVDPAKAENLYAWRLEAPSWEGTNTLRFDDNGDHVLG